MNRAARRSLKRTVAHALKGKRGLAHPVPGSVVFSGGPMDGWIVKPDAPALQAEWYDGFIEAVAAGIYERDRGQGQPLEAPRWIDAGDTTRDPYFVAAREKHPPGRYVLAEDGKRAAWQSQP